MANIESDYEATYKQATPILETAQALNRNIGNVYGTIGNMHTVWFGIRYNELVQAFNNMIDDLNSVLKLVVTDIPFSLKTVANNYSQADRGVNCGPAEQVGSTPIEALPTPADVGMKFEEAPVTEYKGRVENYISQAISNMQQIETLFNQVHWESEAATNYRTSLKNDREKISRAFDDVKQTFATKMTQSIEDINRAESSSNVNG